MMKALVCCSHSYHGKEQSVAEESQRQSHQIPPIHEAYEPCCDNSFRTFVLFHHSHPTRDYTELFCCEDYLP
eukprot:13383152-Ditylum_brightwellii.AAC.1